MGGLTLWMVDIYICTIDQSQIEGEKSSVEESAKFTDLSLQVALGRVPCSQTSGLGNQGKCQVY